MLPLDYTTLYQIWIVLVSIYGDGLNRAPQLFIMRRWLAYLAAIICCSVSQSQGFDWDLAHGLEIVSPSLYTGESLNQNRAHNIRKPEKQLRFTSMGDLFVLDIVENYNLLGTELQEMTRGRPMIGTNMRIKRRDGKEDFVETPLARFFVEDQYYCEHHADF